MIAFVLSFIYIPWILEIEYKFFCYNQLHRIVHELQVCPGIVFAFVQITKNICTQISAIFTILLSLTI